MSVHVTIIGSPDRKLEELVRSSGLRPTVASAADLLALTQPTAPQPDILIMDVRGPGQVPATLAALKRQHPATSVIVVASELSPVLMLEAMRAGATECLAEPLSPESVAAAMTRILAQRTAATTGEVFAFVGAKGGVGTTTLAVNVAAALASTHGSTLFIDMHPAYGDASVLLGAEPRFSLMDALDNTHRLDLSFFTGLTTVAHASVTLLASPDNASPGVFDVHRVRLLLDFAARHYRYTVLDIPRSNPTVMDGLEPVTSIFVVTNQELASVRGASRVADALGRRYSRDKVSVLVSRYDGGSEIGVSDIEEVVHAPVRGTFPSDYRRALQALNEGKPFVLEGSSKLSSAVRAFTRGLEGRTSATTVRPAKPGPIRAAFSALRWMTSSF